MRRRTLLLVVLMVPILSYVLVGVSIASVFTPARARLSDDQRAVHDDPARDGLRVQALDCLEAQVPCLVVSPSPGALPGKRGRQLREQLQARQVALPPYGQVVGTIVMLHGRNSRKEHLLRIAERFAAAGFRCILPDLPGHGESPLAQPRFGTSDFERSLPARLLEDVRRQLGWTPAPAFLWGYSMGGAVALNAAAEADGQWQGLVIVSSFDRLDAVVDDHLNRHLGRLVALHTQWFSPVGAWLGTPPVDGVQPALIAPHVRLPALVIHGDRDETVDMGRGSALFSALGSADKQWMTVPGAGHRDVFVTDMPVFAQMAAWMLMHRAKDGEAPLRSP